MSSPPRGRADRQLAELLDQALEELEHSVWPAVKGDPALVTALERVRKLPLRRLRPEDLRLAIGQQMGLPFLVPLALGVLERDPFTQGDYYPGDLLVAVARVEAAFWKAEGELAGRLRAVLATALERMAEVNAPTGVERDLRLALARLGR